MLYLIHKFKRYLKICSAISLIMVFYAVFFSDEKYDFFEFVIIAILYTLIPSICVTVANFFREIGMPSFILTKEGMTGILKARIFYTVGPQLIGWIVGIFIATSILDDVFGITVK